MWCLETLKAINQKSNTDDAREIYENLGIITMDYKSEGEFDKQASIR